MCQKFKLIYITKSEEVSFIDGHVWLALLEKKITYIVKKIFIFLL